MPGKWKLVWHDEFRGKTLNTNNWGVYTANYWDKRTHFTKENVFLRDGRAVLKYEKKMGHQNDDPTPRRRSTPAAIWTPTASGRGRTATSRRA